MSNRVNTRLTRDPNIMWIINILSYLANIVLRRQPEHFMKVSCQRMGIIFSVHLVISAVHFFIYSLVQCHKYDYNVQNHQWICVDHLTEADRQEDWNPRNHTSTTIPPDPSTSPTPINIAQMVLNVVSQLLLPLIPASFLYTIRTILLE